MVLETRKADDIRDFYLEESFGPQVQGGGTGREPDGLTELRWIKIFIFSVKRKLGKAKQNSKNHHHRPNTHTHTNKTAEKCTRVPGPRTASQLQLPSMSVLGAKSTERG